MTNTPVRIPPVKPQATTITYNGVEYYAVDEGTVLIAFLSKEEAFQHFTEVLDDYHEALLESHEGTRQ